MTRISVRRRRRRLTDNMARKTSFIHWREQEQWMLPAAISAGAILMYFFDASTGARRRARLRDRFMSSLHRSQEALATTWRDARNRGRGLYEESRLLMKSRPVNDDILIERVRALLGTLVRHPSSIEVMANDGRIVLRGPVLSAEINGLLDGVRKVRGVRAVENRLEVNEQANNIPGLQGDPTRPPGGSQFALLQDNWSPTARMTVGLGGAMLAAYGAFRRDRNLKTMEMEALPSM